jgi:ribosomal protein L3
MARTVKAGPCTVLQVKTVETDGYNAIQLGFEDIKPHRSTMPLIGHAGKAGTGPKRVAREVRLTGEPEVELGAVLTVEQFTEAEVGRGRDRHDQGPRFHRRDEALGVRRPAGIARHRA